VHSSSPPPERELLAGWLPACSLTPHGGSPQSAKPLRQRRRLKIFHVLMLLLVHEPPTAPADSCSPHDAGDHRVGKGEGSSLRQSAHFRNTLYHTMSYNVYGVIHATPPYYWVSLRGPILGMHASTPVFHAVRAHQSTQRATFELRTPNSLTSLTHRAAWLALQLLRLRSRRLPARLPACHAMSRSSRGGQAHRRSLTTRLQHIALEVVDKNHPSQFGAATASLEGLGERCRPQACGPFSPHLTLFLPAF
jgi:hypothetical protein